MTGESLTIVQDQLEKLKQLFPETITEGKIDWEKLQATLGKENIEFSNERYVLNWAGKSEAFKVLQQTTTATLKPCPEESLTPNPSPKEWGATAPSIEEFLQSDCGNLFIEGENLEVLKVLQKSYYGKVKVVCIDPPYNTGNDSFIYPDSFKESREEYQKRIGEKDEEGYLMKEGFFRKNSKDSGHYHSNWLSMMYPRLFLAKNLLKDDGVIFVHIDDNEVHNLRMIMNEIFGEDNFVGQISRATGTPTGQGTNRLVSEIDYILVYSKSTSSNLSGMEFTEADSKIYTQEDLGGKYLTRPLRKTGGEDKRADRPSMYYSLKDPDNNDVFPIGPGGYESRWRCSRSKYDENLKRNLIEWKKIKNEDGLLEWKPYLKFYLEGRLKQVSNLWQEIAGNKKASVDLKNLFGLKIFDFPKPVEVIKKTISVSADEGDIILDFFAGSATTAHAVLELNKEDGGNRKFILVQLPEPCDETSEAFKAGYKTIADISKERIRRVINRLNSRQTGTSYDLPDSKINQNNEIEAQQKLFTEKENPVNQINPANPGSDNGFKVFKLASSSFKIWRSNDITDENLEQQLEMFTDPVREGSEKENMLYELILKAGYLLTDKIKYKNKLYYVKEGELILALEEINQEIIDTVLTPAPSGRAGAGLQKVITLDRLFTGNDQLKTNAVLQMKDAEIDFKTI
ncbi:MAG: adenine-specific [Prolixibacteraceae bacterium]|nr:MAG: adenine-specific [Prolixibacteraceae bacterium]